jgi:hypothetical protein
VFLVFSIAGPIIKQQIQPTVNSILGISEISEEEIYYGSAQFKIVQGDFFTGASVSPTNAKYVLYHSKPGVGVTGTSISASGTTTELLKSDKGYVWMEIYGGDDYYLMEDEFLAGNGRVAESYWDDYDGDGKDEFVVKLWVGDIGERGQGLTPVVSLSLPLLDEDTASWSDDDPSDQSGIGTGETTVTITWKLSGITAEDGAVFGRLYFATNSTRGGDDVRFEEMSLSGGWTIKGQTSWGAPVYEENGNYEAWYIRTDDYLEPHNGIAVYRSTNAADALYVTVSVRCTFETGDVVSVTLYADVIGPDGDVTTVSDAVNLSA